MKKTIAITAFLTLAFFSANAQNKVMLHSKGQVTQFSSNSPFVTAYDSSQNGDTIYLSGGTFTMPSSFNKGVQIFGAGHFPDSTKATQPTILQGAINLAQGADSLRVEGVYITGDISFANNVTINQIGFNRCRFSNVNIIGTSNKSQNISFTECVVSGNFSLQNAERVLISNSIILGRVFNGNELSITNNVFQFHYGGWHTTILFDQILNSYIANNIVFYDYDWWIYSGCTGSTFANNVFRVSSAMENTSSNFVGNVYSVNFDSLFTNLPPNNSFSYTYNYHLRNPSNYLGNDNTQVGIYGGLFPFKEGSVPVNPYIRFFNAAPKTDNDGMLEVEIEVSAQDN